MSELHDVRSTPAGQYRKDTNAPPVTGPATLIAEPPSRSAARPLLDGKPVQILLRSLWIAALAVAAFLGLAICLLALYRFVDPPMTTLTAARWIAGETIDQTWVPLERMSPQLPRAVVASEDARFCQHWGVDPVALEAALEDWWSGTARGGSTISMQVVKNLFLWPQRSIVRKGLELPLSLMLELLWSKRRIIEVYLNIAEWGPNVFGAEAAARYHFDKTASQLEADEAARLAVSLPNPIARDAGEPSARVRSLAGLIRSRMRSANLACLRNGADLPGRSTRPRLADQSSPNSSLKPHWSASALTAAAASASDMGMNGGRTSRQPASSR